MAKKNQSSRLTVQHKESKGVIGIFGEEAKLHDVAIGNISHQVIEQLQKEFPRLTFRYRTSITKKEINEALKKVDPELGQTLFVSNSSIIPDGGIIEVQDDNGEWRIVLVSEAKHQERRTGRQEKESRFDGSRQCHRTFAQEYCGDSQFDVGRITFPIRPISGRFQFPD